MSEAISQIRFIIENRWEDSCKMTVRVATPEEVQEDGPECYDVEDTLRYVNRRARENHATIQEHKHLNGLAENAGAQLVVMLAEQWKARS